MSNSKEVVRILSIDGGGIRGILPLSILQYLEEKTEASIHQLFDVIGGTSTGGIIALGLNSTNPETKEIYTAKDILDFYVTDARKKIFITNKDSFMERILTGFRDNITSKLPVLNKLAGKYGSGIFISQYSGQQIEDFLKKKFGEQIKLSELSTACDVTVYSYDIENDEPYCFNNKDEATNDYYVWQAARSTSAAPTFFSALEIFNSNSGIRFKISEKSSPTLAVHQNKLYMAWRGAGEGIYYASFDGKNWLDQKRAGTFKISKNSSPVLAVHQDKLYMAWRGAGEGIYYASFDGKNWLDQKRAGTFEISKNSSPALVVHQDKFYMAWRGAGKGIYYANFDGKNWLDQKQAGTFGISKNTSPALAVHQDKLYMAWRGAALGKADIYYASFDGQNWLNQNRAGTFKITNNSSPALAVHQDKLYMAWRGADEGIYYASFDDKNWSNQNRAGTFGISEHSSPALAVYAPTLKVAPTLELPGDSSIFVFDSSTLAFNQDRLYMAWRGAGKGYDKIYYANFDIKNWSMQKKTPNFKTLVDGAIFINNPAMDLFVTAKKLNPNAKQFVLVSLGTGNFLEAHLELKNAGFLLWLRPLIAYIMKGVSITVNDQLKEIIAYERSKPQNTTSYRYYRFESIFGKNIEIDAIDTHDIQRLQELGTKLVEDNKSELNDLVERLKSYRNNSGQE